MRNRSVTPLLSDELLLDSVNVCQRVLQHASCEVLLMNINEAAIHLSLVRDLHSCCTHFLTRIVYMTARALGLATVVRTEIESL